MGSTKGFQINDKVRSLEVEEVTNPLSPYISDKCYKSIEDALEEVWYSFPFHRIYKDGEPLGYEEITSTHHLKVVDVMGYTFTLQLVNNNSGEVVWERIVLASEGVVGDCTQEVNKHE